MKLETDRGKYFVDGQAMPYMTQAEFDELVKQEEEKRTSVSADKETLFL